MKKILHEELLMYKAQEKKHKKIKFNINEKMNLLKFEFEYSPKGTTNENDIVEAFKYEKCEMTLEEAEFYKNKYIKEKMCLKNLVTFSIYYEDEYIGCGHRGIDKQEIIISSKESSPGFKNVEVNKGKWEVVLSIHAINTNKINILLKGYVE